VIHVSPVNDGLLTRIQSRALFVHARCGSFAVHQRALGHGRSDWALSFSRFLFLFSFRIYRWEYTAMSSDIVGSSAIRIIGDRVTTLCLISLNSRETCFALQTNPRGMAEQRDFRSAGVSFINVSRSAIWGVSLLNFTLLSPKAAPPHPRCSPPWHQPRAMPRKIGCLKRDAWSVRARFYVQVESIHLRARWRRRRASPCTWKSSLTILTGGRDALTMTLRKICLEATNYSLLLN
jgi:hypothetical protein